MWLRACGWKDDLSAARALVPDDGRATAHCCLIEYALKWLRSNGVVAPNMIRIDRRLLVDPDSVAYIGAANRLDVPSQADASIRGAPI